MWNKAGYKVETLSYLVHVHVMNKLNNLTHLEFNTRNYIEYMLSISSNK